MARPTRRLNRRRGAGAGTVLVLGSLLLALLTNQAAVAAQDALPRPPDGPPTGFSARETTHFRYYVQSNPDVDAPAFAAAYGPMADRAFDELAIVFGLVPPSKTTLLVHADDQAFVAATSVLPTPETTIAGAFAVADRAANRIHLALPRLLTGSPLEAENALRHALAHVMVTLTAGDRVPRGFDEGIAQYVERPVNPKLARIAAHLQNANQSGDLPSWSDLNRPQPRVQDADLLNAEAYAVVAFLVDRFGLRTFGQFLATMRTEPDWRAAMRAVYDRPPDEIEQQWRDYLPRWVAGGWRLNLVAAFDLQPARDLLAKAHYAAAKAKLEESLRLANDLGDEPRKVEVDRLRAQADTGLQAEALMTQTQQALERHTYDRAQSLLVQARDQYNQLPPEQRPEEMLATYERLATSGVQAAADLDEARRLANSWGDYPKARAAAVDAGTSFAHLGDEEMTQRARSILDDLDARQRRVVLMLGALGALTIAWLALWLWARGRSELDWAP